MKINCCPGVVLSGILLLGASAVAVLSQIPWDMPSCSSKGGCSGKPYCAVEIPPPPSSKGQSCCQETPPPQTEQPGQGQKPAPAPAQGEDKEATPAPAPDPKNPIKKVQLGKNVFVEIQGDRRRVVVQSYVCLRQGGLEQLLTTENGKKHESILAAEMDASVIHAGLLACQAKAGHPIRFQPKLEPPAGTVIKITLEYKQKDKLVRVPAQRWIRNTRTGKNMTHDWVFAGSVLIPDPDMKSPPFYGANSGDVICVANMETALLDLPVDSSKDNGELSFEAHTERIPAMDTPVTIILEPVLEKNKK